jgi:hypothetical protein
MTSEISNGKFQMASLNLAAHRAGLPGEEVSFILCPLTPPIPLWRDEARSGQEESLLSLGGLSAIGRR